MTAICSSASRTAWFVQTTTCAPIYRQTSIITTIPLYGSRRALNCANQRNDARRRSAYQSAALVTLTGDSRCNVTVRFCITGVDATFERDFRLLSVSTTRVCGRDLNFVYTWMQATGNPARDRANRLFYSTVSISSYHWTPCLSRLVALTSEVLEFFIINRGMPGCFLYLPRKNRIRICWKTFFSALFAGNGYIWNLSIKPKRILKFHTFFLRRQTRE